MSHNLWLIVSETRFVMPTAKLDTPWYSFNFGVIHVIIMSTEHTFDPSSAQYQFFVNVSCFSACMCVWCVVCGVCVCVCVCVCVILKVISVSIFPSTTGPEDNRPQEHTLGDFRWFVQIITKKVNL